VEIGAEAAQFPGKEYINGIAVAVQDPATTNDSDTRHSAISIRRPTNNSHQDTTTIKRYTRQNRTTIDNRKG
jgi:hypothetical protein